MSLPLILFTLQILFVVHFSRLTPSFFLRCRKRGTPWLSHSFWFFFSLLPLWWSNRYASYELCGEDTSDEIGGGECWGWGWGRQTNSMLWRCGVHLRVVGRIGAWFWFPLRIPRCCELALLLWDVLTSSQQTNAIMGDSGTPPFLNRRHKWGPALEVIYVIY